MQHSIVQDDHARTFQSTAINGRVQLIVAEMVQIDVGIPVHSNVPPGSKSRQQSGAIIRHTGARGGKRRVESDRHGLRRLPKRAVPTRTCVAPSSIATSRS